MSELTERLRADHERIEALCGDLLNRVHAGDTKIIDECFREVDQRLRDHMQFEGEKLLPALARVHLEVAHRARCDHEKILEVLDEVGVAIQCHLLREDHARDLVALVGEHEEHEKNTLYAWAAAHEDSAPWHPPSSGPPVA